MQDGGGIAGNARAELPSGTVTLAFADVADSTLLLQALGDQYASVLVEHQFILRSALKAHGGVEVDTQGDACFFVFRSAADAVLAAIEAQRALARHIWPDQHPVRVRMALHTGEPTLAGDGYVGLDVHRTARLCAAGHAGQVLLSHTTRELVYATLPPGVGVRDLGEHHLKDLHRPEPIFQLVIADLPHEFPPLRTHTTRPHNLPAQATPLVGRERELASISERLLRPGVRLLTLTGPGGTGKTRLGLQVANDVVEHFAHGVHFVALSAIRDPTLVASAIAEALGVPEAAGRPMLETLTDYLRDKHVLLVLDNFEQLMPASALVADLLLNCRQLTILVTSRSVLHVYGEHDFAVPPLALPAREPPPAVDHLIQFEACRLFVERARAAKSDFAVTARSGAAVAEICHRLDGLPLGIELAAARVRVLPPETMLGRMERRLPLLTGGPHDRPSRHQTLRSAIAWSYDLLDEAEQTLFRRLPVFAGGCSVEAAESICGGWETGSTDVLDGLTSLIDKSLLREEHSTSGDSRLLMLETIREYGLERLDASGEADEVRRRHAMYYLELAEQAAPMLHEPDQVAWLDRLDAEHDNLRAVRAWTQADSTRTEIGLRLSVALLWFWLVRGYVEEGGRALDAGLAAADAISPSVRARALNAAGHLAQYRRNFAASAALLEESMALARELGDVRAAADSQSLLGVTARSQGDQERAISLMEDALAEQLRLGDGYGSRLTLFRLAETARSLGQHERAAALHQESLRLRREMGDIRGIGASLHSLGLLALARGDFAEAATTLKQGLVLHRDTRNRFGTAMCLEGLAAVALEGDELERAARLLGALEALLGVIGAALLPGERARYEQNLEHARARLDARIFEATFAGGQAMHLDEAIAYALE